MKNRYLHQTKIVNQNKLKKSSVIIAGLGGLGSFSSLLLSLAGVGKLVLVDNDVIEESNLNRQVLYREEDIGKRKAEVAAKRIKEINPHTSAIPIVAEINDEFDLPDVDIVVDGLDNYQSRISIEGKALKQDVPYIFGAVGGYMGMVTFIDSHTKRLEDFIHKFKSENPQVLGATAAMVASIQAMEVVKYLSGRGDLLKNKLLIYDGLSTNFVEVEL